MTSPNTIHQRRRKQLQSSIPRHFSPTKSRQNHLGKNLQKTNAHKPVPEIHITQSNICKTKCGHCLIRPSRQCCFKRKGQNFKKKQHRRKEQPRERPEEEPKQTKSINLPCIQGFSEQLKRALNKHNIKATFYTQTTLRSLLSKPKDHIPKEDRNNAVYQLNCKDCEAAYVGETKRTLNIRADENIKAIKSARKKSHTAEHCWKYNHDFDWKVLDFEKNWKTRTIKESIYSEENDHHINGIYFKLPNIWKPILPDSKAKKTTAKTTASSN